MPSSLDQELRDQLVEKYSATLEGRTRMVEAFARPLEELIALLEMRLAGRSLLSSPSEDLKDWDGHYDLMRKRMHPFEQTSPEAVALHERFMYLRELRAKLQGLVYEREDLTTRASAWELLLADD